MTDVAVLVVGSGSAGMAAALSAREDGAPSVLVAEAEAEGVVGGSSRLSGGLIIGAGTRYQRALSIEDGPDLRYKQHVPGSSKKQSPHWR